MVEKVKETGIIVLEKGIPVILRVPFIPLPAWWRMPHLKLQEQVINLNRILRGPNACYGIACNLRALQKVHRLVEH